MNPIKKVQLAIIIIFLSHFAIAGNFLTDSRKDPVFIGEKQEIKIGRNVDQNIRNQYKVSTNKELQDYINQLGQNLVRHSSRKKLAFTFTLLDDKLVNAFAAPGGYIYITTGILKLLKNEAEVSGVLGHEIGHVVHKHSLKAIQRQMIASFGLKIVAIGLGRKQGIGKDLILAGSQIGTNLLLLKNSRENEFQADNEGVRIMNAAGYNPSGMIQIQEMLLKLTGGKNPPAIISTHPPSQERIKMIKKQIAEMGNTSSTYNENEYLQYLKMLK